MPWPHKAAMLLQYHLVFIVAITNIAAIRILAPISLTVLSPRPNNHKCVFS